MEWVNVYTEECGNNNALYVALIAHGLSPIIYDDNEYTQI